MHDEPGAARPGVRAGARVRLPREGFLRLLPESLDPGQSRARPAQPAIGLLQPPGLVPVRRRHDRAGADRAHGAPGVDGCQRGRSPEVGVARQPEPVRLRHPLPQRYPVLPLGCISVCRAGNGLPGPVPSGYLQLVRRWPARPGEAPVPHDPGPAVPGGVDGELPPGQPADRRGLPRPGQYRPGRPGAGHAVAERVVCRSHRLVLPHAADGGPRR